MRRPSQSDADENGGPATAARIDRWLWCTRLFKTRSLAAAAVGGGKVHLNGQRVKPAHGLRPGDQVAISRPGFTFQCEVLALPAHRGSATVAQACYRESDEARAAREKYVEQSRLVSAMVPRSLERPDKHGRRELRRLRGRE